MIQLSPNRKNKIDLSDYDFKRDIKNRLLMATFSTFDVDVLDEILNNSLKISLNELAKDLECTLEQLDTPLQKFIDSRLIKLSDDFIQVDKEMRKYYEFQILKFDHRFKPGMEFFQRLLSKVPIHVLPNWYSIPRTSNNIFQSIIEKYLLTPKVFQRYLLELNLDNPILNGIIKDVFESPNFKLRSKELREKYDLSQDEFEEYMLHLEFNAVCCLSYSEVDGQWKEVVTPFYEWEEHLRFLKEHQPDSIADSDVQCNRDIDFAFIHDVESFIRVLISSNESPKGRSLPLPLVKKVMEKCRLLNMEASEAQVYFGKMIEKLKTLRLMAEEDGEFLAGRHTDAWLEQASDKKALFFYNNPKHLNLFMDQHPGYTERQLREVEKNLSIISNIKWVSISQFIQRLMAPIGKTEPVMLKKQGKKWLYVRPQYNSEDKAFIKSTLLEWLNFPGMVLSGTSKTGELCFKLTEFGRSILG